MNYDRNMDKKINRIQENALQIMYKDTASDFGTLLRKDNSVPTHVNNLQLLMKILKSIKSSS